MAWTAPAVRTAPGNGPGGEPGTTLISPVRAFFQKARTHRLQPLGRWLDRPPLPALPVFGL